MKRGLVPNCLNVSLLSAVLEAGSSHHTASRTAAHSFAGWIEQPAQMTDTSVGSRVHQTALDLSRDVRLPLQPWDHEGSWIEAASRPRLAAREPADVNKDGKNNHYYLAARENCDWGFCAGEIPPTETAPAMANAVAGSRNRCCHNILSAAAKSNIRRSVCTVLSATSLRIYVSVLNLVVIFNQRWCCHQLSRTYSMFEVGAVGQRRYTPCIDSWLKGRSGHWTNRALTSCHRKVSETFAFSRMNQGVVPRRSVVSGGGVVEWGHT